MYKIKTIDEVPVLKSLQFLGIIKKAIYTLYIADYTISDSKYTYEVFEDNFLKKDIEAQKVGIHYSLSMKLSFKDDADEILDCLCNFIYTEVLGVKTNINRLCIESISVYNQMIGLMLDNIYMELVEKKLIQP